MKANLAVISEIERLLCLYEQEVEARLKEGYLQDSTAKTYILHADNFVKWCKGSFVPGGKNIPTVKNLNHER